MAAACVSETSESDETSSTKRPFWPASCVLGQSTYGWPGSSSRCIVGCAASLRASVWTGDQVTCEAGRGGGADDSSPMMGRGSERPGGGAYGLSASRHPSAVWLRTAGTWLVSRTGTPLAMAYVPTIARSSIVEPSASGAAVLSHQRGGQGQ